MLNYGKVLGPYTRKDKRQHVVVWDKIEKRWRTISYPKYFLEKELDRRLTSIETADHIDNNKTNNDINNLQILTRKENILKSVVPEEILTFICKCSKEFKLVARRYKANQMKQNKSGPFCSKSCAGFYSYR